MSRAQIKSLMNFAIQISLLIILIKIKDRVLSEEIQQIASCIRSGDIWNIAVDHIDGFEA